MAKIEWIDGHIKTEPIKKPKKLTGTRFAAVLGMNHWTTPFEVWCAVMRVYEKPFEDTIYTIAGKTIEPKQAAYAKLMCGFPGFVTPEDRYGKDYFKKTYGDFFPEHDVFGGMWDYLSVSKDKETTVLEMKTTKRAEDWADDIPEYYALQAALYAYLLDTDNVCMVASFLEESDYEHPADFVPTNKNTVTIPFKLSERYPNFYDDYILPAEQWWVDHVDTGISPAFDEKKDAEILKELRKISVDMSSENKEDLLSEAEDIKAELDKRKKEIKPLEDRLKLLTDGFKKDSEKSLGNGIKEVVIEGSKYKWTTTCVESLELDTDAMKADGVYDKYLTKVKKTIRTTVTAVKNKK